MNTLGILLSVLLTCATFTIMLRAYISVSQSERQKFLIGYLGLFIILVIVFFVLPKGLPSFLPLLFLAFGSVIPQVVARFIKFHQIKMKEPVLKIRTSDPSSIVWFIGILFLLFLTLMILIPNKISLPEGKPIYDAEYFYSRFTALLYIIPSIILFSMNAFQKVIFRHEGLIHNGLSWEWSDFQIYSWRKNPKKKKHQELLLITANNVWTPSQIKLTVSNESREQIDFFLAQKLKKASESA